MTGIAFELQYVDPRNGRTLTFEAMDDAFDGPGGVAMADGVWRADDGFGWPQIDGIAYLRAGHEALAEAAATRLQSGERATALGLLLCDVDDHASSAPAVTEAIAVGQSVGSGQCSALAAMRRLAYGPVADYFAMRPSTPTYLSGLELLAMPCRPRAGFGRLRWLAAWVTSLSHLDSHAWHRLRRL